MDHTSRMVSLLGSLRKEMNGAVLDTLRYYGADYGMNYGVAIHSLRRIASEIGTDDEFARFLYRQQVRELKLIALSIADPKTQTKDDLQFWASGIINSEIAEYSAHALLSKINDLEHLFKSWCRSDKVLLVYASLLATSYSTNMGTTCLSEVLTVVDRWRDDHLVAQGVIALCDSVRSVARDQVRQMLAQLPDCPTADSIREEMLWRLEY